MLSQNPRLVINIHSFIKERFGMLIKKKEEEQTILHYNIDLFILSKRRLDEFGVSYLNEIFPMNISYSKAGRELYLFCVFIYPESLEQCLGHRLSKYLFNE